jgi:hypothetical protein
MSRQFQIFAVSLAVMVVGCGGGANSSGERKASIEPEMVSYVEYGVNGEKYQIRGPIAPKTPGHGSNFYVITDPDGKEIRIKRSAELGRKEVVSEIEKKLTDHFLKSVMANSTNRKYTVGDSYADEQMDAEMEGSQDYDRPWRR